MKVKVYDTYRKREVLISNEKWERMKRMRASYATYKYIEYVPDDFEIKSLTDLEKINKNTNLTNNDFDVLLNTDKLKEEELSLIKEKHKEEIIDTIYNTSGITKEQISSIISKDELIEPVEFEKQIDKDSEIKEDNFSNNNTNKSRKNKTQL